MTNYDELVCCANLVKAWAERDALAALLQECRDDWLRLAYGASHEDVAAYRDFATRVDAALAGKDAT